MQKIIETSFANYFRENFSLQCTDWTDISPVKVYFKRFKKTCITKCMYSVFYAENRRECS